LKCKKGSGENGNYKINLEGINSLRPLCKGHKPWQISLIDSYATVPSDSDCVSINGQPNSMQVSLATGNNVYFANSFSSIYIPMELATGTSPTLEKGLRICTVRFELYCKNAKASGREVTKQQWAAMNINESFVYENYSDEIKDEDLDEFLFQLKKMFLAEDAHVSIDFYEEYRWQEYKTFTNPQSSRMYDGLRISPTELPSDLRPFLLTINAIEELKVSTVQLDFTRVRPAERVRLPDGHIATTHGQSIFSHNPNEVFILPANESYGEGIFFQFDDREIQKWMTDHKQVLESRIQNLLPNGQPFNANQLRDKINENRAKLLLIHTFSHLLMKEFEFSCGYPTASLKERLYISPRMNGILIYTAEGSEGSMGGLIWQAQPAKIRNIIIKALNRANDCSSDPLCWECEGQGIFDMNLAACFSCSLTSETSCEELNLGLDRRVLIDPVYGYFTRLLSINNSDNVN